MSDEIVSGRDAAHDGFRPADDAPRPQVRLAAPVELSLEQPAAPVPPRPPMSTRTQRLLVAGLAVVVVLVAVPVLLTRGSDSKPVDAAPSPSAPAALDTAAADAFRDRMRQEFSGIGGVTNVYLVSQLTGWKDGTLTTSQAKAAMLSVLPAVTRARVALAAIASFDAAPESIKDYQGALTTYAQALRLGLAGTALPDGPLQRQLRLQALRLQALGDRMFDQGGRDLDGFLAKDPDVSAVTFQPAPEIPDFTNRGLLAGAPLVVAPRLVVTGVNPEGQNRQADESWIAAVNAAGIPTAQEVAAAINAVDGPVLGALANKLQAVTLAVRALDDPSSGRADATRVQLSLLIDAEAARAAEAAAQATGPAKEQLLVVARTLAALSDERWDPRLTPRDTGYPRALITAD